MLAESAGVVITGSKALDEMRASTCEHSRQPRAEVASAVSCHPATGPANVFPSTAYKEHKNNCALVSNSSLKRISGTGTFCSPSKKLLVLG